MMVRLGLIAGLLISWSVGSESHAADVPSGLKAARSLCVNCHIVEPGGAKSEATADVPSFMAIAAKPGQTEAKLKAFMLSPHPPMPQVQLTNNELENLAAYIVTLKQPN